jgi:acyl dehydratase
MGALFLEDFVVGQVFASTRPLRVEKDEIIAFAKKFDPQFFHVDEEAARSSIFGGLVASGWHTAALTMRLLTERESKPAGGSIGLGFDELRWPIPVRPGDELCIESEVLDVRPSKSRPDYGLIKMRTRTLNQHGQVVQEIVQNAMVPRRPPAESDKRDAARSTPQRRAV